MAARDSERTGGVLNKYDNERLSTLFCFTPQCLLNKAADRLRAVRQIILFAPPRIEPSQWLGLQTNADQLPYLLWTSFLCFHDIMT
ncbi:MAG TPA: hypothetical protein VGJ76_10950 [Pseudolabrys sp.]